MVDGIDGSEQRYRWRRCRCNYLITFDNDKIHFHRDTTCLYKEHIVDFIVAHFMLLCIYVDVDAVN